jgi:hypothetical protein
MKLRLVFLVAFALFGISCNGGTGVSPSSPTVVPATNLPEYSFIQTILYQNADPRPLPQGSPQVFCGPVVPTSGKITAELVVNPGGTMLQASVILYEDYQTKYCPPEMDSCPGAIEPMNFTNNLNKAWQVTSGRWCLELRNRTTSAQIINGPILLYYK